MFSKAKNWIVGKPKNQHSLENLKYLYGILNKNQTVTENNKDLLIETLRSISEILIWGDQNDSSVFDFFLEKQMITFFLHYMKQKYGRFICVQLLQTLNILFENIRHETSLYFLLSNNHINQIILNKFDFSDEEVMAYYISFLKTLSLKLNTHSIHFFFNERACEFPLYVEAIKFFDHPEAMVRIAVRTLTLNVYRVPVASMQKFVKEKTAIFYFSNLVWLIRNHVLDLDLCVKNTVDHTKKNRLIDLIDEYIDHLNYIQDIYMLSNEALSNLLTEQLIRRLLIPVYLCSLIRRDRFAAAKDRKPYIQPLVSLFLLSHFFLVINYAPLVNEVCEYLFYLDDEKILDQICFQKFRSNSIGKSETDYLTEPKSLINCLTSLSTSRRRRQEQQQQQQTQTASGGGRSSRSRSMPHISDSVRKLATTSSTNEQQSNDDSNEEGGSSGVAVASAPENGIESPQNSADDNSTQNEESAAEQSEEIIMNNKTDDEKYRQMSTAMSLMTRLASSDGSSASAKKVEIGILFDALIQHLNNQDYNEMTALLALSFIFTLFNNSGVSKKYIDLLKVKLNSESSNSSSYHDALMSKLIGVVSKAVESDFKVRLVTLELAIKLIKSLAETNGQSYTNDFHLACIEQAREQSAFLLRRQYKTEEMFLDMFEHEYQSLNAQQTVSFEFLLRDWSILLTPTSTPLSGIEFSRRFPCGDTEKLKQTIRIFFLLRDLCINLTNEKESQLPLTKQEHLVKENDVLDLSSSDLIACTVSFKEKRDRRFLVMDPIQFIIVEPEVKRLGWGIVKFCDLIQDAEVTPDKEDSRSLNINIKKSSLSLKGKPEIILNSVFTFDDHIRCMAAKQHLIRSREKARRMKLEKIAQLLDISSSSSSATTPNGSSKSSSFLTSSASNSNIIGYNLVAGLNMLGTNYHPGRASMISQTWSQITGSENKPNSSSLTNSPMTALTSSPMVRNNHPTSTASTSSASNSPYYNFNNNNTNHNHHHHHKQQHQHSQLFSSPSVSGLLSTSSETTSATIKITPHRQTSLTPNYETALIDSMPPVTTTTSTKQQQSSAAIIGGNNSLQPTAATAMAMVNNFQEEKVEKRRSSSISASSIIDKSNIVKTLMANTDQSISLIATSLNDTGSELTSKIQILPPADHHSDLNNSSPTTASSSYNYLKEKSSTSDEMNFY